MLGINWRFVVVVVILLIGISTPAVAQSYYIDFLNPTTTLCQAAWPGNPGYVGAYLYQDSSIPGGAIRRDTVIVAGRLANVTESTQPTTFGLNYTYVQAAFLYDPPFPYPIDYIVELYVGGSLVSRSTLTWTCYGNSTSDIVNDHSPSDGNDTYYPSIYYRGGNRSFTVTYLAEQDIYLIENGADFMAWEIGNVQDEMHGYLNSLLYWAWFPQLIEYFAPRYGSIVGTVESLRESIIAAVCAGHTGCNEDKVRYLIGANVTDTSSLGNIAYGYILDDPLIPLLFPSLEGSSANIDQFFKEEDRDATYESCQLNVFCWVDTLASYSDDSDGIVQRAVGHEFASQVRNSSVPRDGGTLSSIAHAFYLH